MRERRHDPRSEPWIHSGRLWPAGAWPPCWRSAASRWPGRRRAGQEAAAKPAVQAAPHGAYAGTAACLGCHEDLARRDHEGPALPRLPGGHADVAEGLPGLPRRHRRPSSDARPATARARSTRRPAATRRRSARFKSLSAKEASDTCVSCHFRTDHAFWAGSQHDERAVGLHLVPQHPRARRRQPAQGRDPDRPVRAVPPDDRQQAVQVQPHAGARGQDGVLVLPQRARLARTSSC